MSKLKETIRSIIEESNETEPTKVHVEYQSNYNGCSVKVNGVDYADDDFEDAVVDYAGDDCDEDGEYMGDVSNVEEFAENYAKKKYGDDVIFTFEDDSISS